MVRRRVALPRHHRANACGARPYRVPGNLVHSIACRAGPDGRADNFTTLYSSKYGWSTRWSMEIMLASADPLYVGGGTPESTVPARRSAPPQ